MATPCAARQRGAIGLMAALTLGLAMAFMVLVIDSGRLYLEQRKLQRIADMAALEAAGQQAVCSGPGPQANDIARQAATRNGHAPGSPLATNCGYLRSAANSQRSFVVDAVRHEAIRVQASHTVATSIAAGIYTLAQGDGVPVSTTLIASAVAAAPMPPQAMLSIRSTLATVDARQSALLNALLGALGSTAQLDLAGWQGIADTKLNLLKYLDQLAVDLHVKAGDYDKLLGTDATIAQLLDAAVDVLQQNGAAAEVATNLGKLVLGTENQTLLHLGDILDIQNGTAQAGLDASVQLLQLIQGVIQLGISESAASVDLPISVLGLVNGRVQLKVIEPQQLSAVGNPETDEIQVHTAQVRAVISLDLPLLNAVAGLVNAVTTLASPLTGVLSSLLQLNLLDAVQALTCILGIGQCQYVDIQVVPDKVVLQVGIEASKAQSRVSDHACRPAKRLTATTRTAAASVQVGRFDSPAEFFTHGNAALKPLPLVDIGIVSCKPFVRPCPRKAFAGGGLGLRLDAPILQSDLKPLTFDNPPDIGSTSAYLSMTTQNPLSSLSSTLAGVQVEAYKPDVDNVLGGLMQVASGVLSTVKGILEPLLKNVLSPLVDPILNTLLKTLGVDLATGEVGANLTCSSGHAQLVE